jgi:hypothetical protein
MMRRTYVLGCILLVLGLGVLACNVDLGGGGDENGSDDDDDQGDDTTDDDTTDDDDASPPDYPTTHDPSWNCFICHEPPLFNTVREPHGDTYTPPDDCVGCHQMGDQPNPPGKPAGHALDAAHENCLGCHTGEDLHGRTWEEAAQCRVCHQTGEGDDDDEGDD